MPGWWKWQRKETPDTAWNAAAAALPESHRGEAERALVAGRTMAASLQTADPTADEGAD